MPAGCPSFRELNHIPFLGWCRLGRTTKISRHHMDRFLWSAPLVVHGTNPFQCSRVHATEEPDVPLIKRGGLTFSFGLSSKGGGRVGLWGGTPPPPPVDPELLEAPKEFFGPN